MPWHGFGWLSELLVPVLGRKFAEKQGMRTGHSVGQPLHHQSRLNLLVIDNTQIHTGISCSTRAYLMYLGASDSSEAYGLSQDSEWGGRRFIPVIFKLGANF